MAPVKEGVPPPAKNVLALVLEVPEVPDPPLLAVANSLTSVQLVPSHDSVSVKRDGPFEPPKTKAAVERPPVPLRPFFVFKLPTSVQADPFQTSAFTE